MNHATSESRIQDIVIAEIDRSRNHRLQMPGDKERIEDLKGGIKSCGQLQPIRVYERGASQKHGKDKPYILGFGARRCAALELLGQKAVRAIVFPPATDAEIAQARAVENLHRLDITPLEEVRAVSDVLEAVKADPKFKGDPHEEAATRLGRPIAWVKDRDYLHRLTKPVQQFAFQSSLPAGHLRELAKVGDPADQMRLACESAGAPSWCFPADGGQADASHLEMRERYFAGLADGKVERWPLSRLKAEVAKAQFSLKLIPWEFDQPIQHGEIKLRKCAGCPHNSETDRTLFGIEEDAANPHGFCLNAACYRAKHTAVEAAKDEVLKKVERRQDKTPAAIRTVAPKWLKESSVVGYVKRQLEKGEEGKNTPKKSRPSYSGRDLTDHEKALQKFSKELHAWTEKSFASVLNGINKEAAYRVGWCVLLGVEAFRDHPSPNVPHVSEYGPPITDMPTIPAVPEEIGKAITLAFKGNRQAWLELLANEEQGNPDLKTGLGVLHPGVLELLAAAVDVKLSASPQWTPAEAKA